MVEVGLKPLRAQSFQPERCGANDDVFALEARRSQTLEQVPAARACRGGHRRSDWQPILLRELLGELDSLSCDPRVVRSAANPPSHLRPQLDDFAIDLAPRHRSNGSEPGRATFWIPRKRLELVAILELGVQSLELDKPDLSVETHESRLVSGQARAAVANAGAQEMWAEAMVEPDTLRHLDDVRADRLAHVRDLVDERDAGHEERIRGELDHLGRRNICLDNRSLDPAVETLDRDAVLLGERPDHDPVRVEEVAHRVPFGQELRIGDVANVREPAALQRGPNLLARTDRHRGLHHQYLPP